MLVSTLLYFFQSFTDVAFNPGFNVSCTSTLKFLTNDILIQFNVPFRYLIHKIIGHFRNFLSFLTLEVILNKPLPNKLFG